MENLENALEINNLKMSAKEQEALRMKVVRIGKKTLKANGKYDAKKVAEICECSLQHVYNVMSNYEKGGIAAIKAKKMGRPKGSGQKLSPEQEREIIGLITEKNPNQMKLKGYLWDRVLVAELIKQRFGIAMPLSTMGYYLAKWGFSAQRPKKQHYKQKPAEVAQWLEEEYPAVEADAKAESAEIFWVDETGIQNQCNYIKGYAPIGQTPTIPVASEHIRVNMVSAITNRGKLRFCFYREKMNQKLYIDFLKKLIKGSPGKVYAIMDNLPTHHGTLVKEWADKIRLFYLPAYSPKLNPDEYLNNNLKHEMAKRDCAASEDEIQKQAESVMRSIQKKTGRVESFFNHKDVQYAKK